jgi:hypothetical protein
VRFWSDAIPANSAIVASRTYRFWDIAQGAANTGEAFSLECGFGYIDSIVNNAFVWSHAYDCSRPSVGLKARVSTAISSAI